MKTLRLADGDLVIGTNRDYAPVTGAAKVMQDLRGALLEPLGNDRFHLGYGSRLESFVAMVGDEGAIYEVEQEVRRVVANYAAIQRDRIEAETYGGVPTTFTTDEVVDTISGVSARVSNETVRVSVVVGTAAGGQIVLSEAL